MIASRKKDMKSIVVFSSVALVLGFLACVIGCKSNIYDVMSRSNEDPLSESPVVASFARLDGIFLSWPKDELADSFIVYRKQMPSGATRVLYNGEDAFVLDATVSKEAVYQYTLAKVRGTKEFAVGLPVYAAFDERYIKDPNGNNETKEQAHPFTTFEISDYVAYYSDGSGHSIIDVDWYYTDLPPHTQRIIRLQYTDCAGGSIDLALAVETNVRTPMSTGKEFNVTNGSDSDQRVYFSVTPNVSVLGSDPKKMWSYKLNFVALQSYNPI